MFKKYRRVKHYDQPGDAHFLTFSCYHEFIQYIHNNPVRRGLVERAEDWEYSSSRAWLWYSNPLLTIDRDSVPPLVC